eukprot:Rhum_TRINITY_DN459_c0_g2::Rhum_TRINITY_DN459_c0_g2_i1::g.1386::m.1386
MKCYGTWASSDAGEDEVEDDGAGTPMSYFTEHRTNCLLLLAPVALCLRAVPFPGASVAALVVAVLALVGALNLMNVCSGKMEASLSASLGNLVGGFNSALQLCLVAAGAASAASVRLVLFGGVAAQLLLAFGLHVAFFCRGGRPGSCEPRRQNGVLASAVLFAGVLLVVPSLAAERSADVGNACAALLLAVFGACAASLGNGKSVGEQPHLFLQLCLWTLGAAVCYVVVWYVAAPSAPALVSAEVLYGLVLPLTVALSSMSSDPSLDDNVATVLRNAAAYMLLFAPTAHVFVGILPLALHQAACLAVVAAVSKLMVMFQLTFLEGFMCAGVYVLTMYITVAV